MNLRAYRSFQALILAGLGIYLLSKVLDGRILFYISQRFVLLVLLAALGLIFLAQLVLRERPAQAEEEEHPHAAETHDHAGDESCHGWVLWIVALPVLFGLLVPERPLGASALASRGVNTSTGFASRGSAQQALLLPPEQRNVLDWIKAAQEDPQAKQYAGQPADVTGFIYHDPRLSANQFMVSRFAIACCVADAISLGMVVDWPQAAALPENRWVRVRGPVRALELDGKNLPAISASQVEIIPDPEQPYLFP